MRKKRASSGARLFLGQDLLQIGQDLVDLGLLQLALAKSVVSLDDMTGVQDYRDIGVLVDLHVLGPGGIVNGEDGLFDLFLVGKILELLLETFIIIAEDDEAAQA